MTDRQKARPAAIRTMPSNSAKRRRRNSFAAGGSHRTLPVREVMSAMVMLPLSFPCRPRRARDEPLPLGPLDRPRGDRAGRGGQLVAQGAVGLAPPAHPELAVPPARLRVPGRRPRRLHDDARGRRLHRGLREGGRRPGADRHDGDVGAPLRARLPRHDRPGRVGLRRRRAGVRSVQRAARAGHQRNQAGLRRNSSLASSTRRGSARRS